MATFMFPSVSLHRAQQAAPSSATTLAVRSGRGRVPRSRVRGAARCDASHPPRLKLSDHADKASQNMPRREVLTGGAALAGLACVPGDLLLPAAALAAAVEAPVFWDGEGRRPHAVVTGSNTGIGKSAAEELVRRGWSVTLACRSPSKAEAARQDILAATSADPSLVDCGALDLADFGSVRAFSEAWLQTGRPIDALLNNAGVMAVFPQEFTKDDHELTFQVNHLGHFLLTCLLEEPIKAGSVNGSNGGRVINTSSLAHTFNTKGMHFDDLDYKENPYKRWDAYGQSKLANILMARELDQRCQQISGCGVTAYSYHPGIVATELQRYIVPPSMMQDMQKNPERSLWVATHLFGLSEPGEGASTGVYLATSKGVPATRGEYFDDSHLGKCTPAGKDMKAAAKLWQVSLDITGAPQNAWTA